MSDIDYEALIVDDLAGCISREDKDVLLDWIGKSEENRALFLSYRDAWLATSMLANRQNSRADGSYKEMMAGVRSFRHWRIGRVMLKIAVAFGLLVMGGSASYFLYDYLQTNDRPEYCKVLVPKGSRSEVLLPDGTSVWLNAGSSLEYDNKYGVTNRDLKLGLELS